MLKHLKALKRKIKTGVEAPVHALRARITRWRRRRCERAFARQGHATELTKIPIIINNCNRLTYLKMLLASLEERNYRNILILDNASTYEPLLKFYEDQGTRYEILRMARNLGPYALWESGVIRRFRRSYFVYTDPDIVPVAECPADFMEYFYKALVAHPQFLKVGFGLKIDDLPGHYKLREKVIQWEQRMWTTPVDGFFEAAVDTTFALYRPWSGNADRPSLRAGWPYVARHMPWYANSESPTEEDRYYEGHAQAGASWWADDGAKAEKIMALIKQKTGQ